MTNAVPVFSPRRQFGADIPKLLRIISADLYPEPVVFLRELLANSYDATLRRESLEPCGSRPPILIEAMSDGCVAVHDEGIGMTEGELIEFLSKMGGSSADSPGRPASSIGRFGVGFLSVLAVAESIEVDSRSAADAGAGARLWRWSGEDRYDILPGSRKSVGTTVQIALRQEFSHYADADMLRSEIRKRVPFLDIPIHVNDAGDPRSKCTLPRRSLPVEERFRMAVCPTVLPLESQRSLHFFSTGLQRGGWVAFAIPEFAAQGAPVQLYLKGVLVTERSEGVMPPGWDWISGLIDMPEGKLTLDRSWFQSNPELQELRDEIGRLLTEELVWMASNQPERFRAAASVHRRKIISLLLQSRTLMEQAGPKLPFETTSGQITYEAMQARSAANGGAKKIYFLDRTPLSDPRWLIARANGRVVAWCRDAFEIALLKALVTNSPGFELAELGWGPGPVGGQPVPTLSLDMQPCLDKLRTYLTPHGISVEAAVLDPATVISAVELSSNTELSAGAQSGPAGGLLGALSRVYANLAGPGAQNRPHGRLLLNVASADMRALLALGGDGSVGIAAALLFLAATSRTGVDLPAEWQPVVSRLIDGAVDSAANSGPDSSPDASPHAVCFFAHQFNRDKPLLAAIRAVLEHRPFYWEVRSADETVKDPKLFDNVFTQLKQSHVVASAIRGGNPNVMIETGMAYGLSGAKPVVLLSDTDCATDIADLRAHLLFLYSGARLLSDPREFQDRFRNWVMQQESLSRFTRKRPFLGYRLLQEAKLLDANESVTIQTVFPDARRFASAAARTVSEKTGISERRIVKMQDLLQNRLRDSNDYTLTV